MGNTLSQQETITYDELYPTELKYPKIAETVLTVCMMHIFKNEIDDSNEYETYDGSKLPCPSGCNMTNAMATYISHGGDKSVAVHKFIAEHLGTKEKLEAFTEKISTGIRDLVE